MEEEEEEEEEDLFRIVLEQGGGEDVCWLRNPTKPIPRRISTCGIGAAHIVVASSSAHDLASHD